VRTLPAYSGVGMSQSTCEREGRGTGMLGAGYTGTSVPAVTPQHAHVHTHLPSSRPPAPRAHLGPKNGREVLRLNATQDNVAVGDGQHGAALGVAHRAGGGAHTCRAHTEHACPHTRETGTGVHFPIRRSTAGADERVHQQQAVPVHGRGGRACNEMGRARTRAHASHTTHAPARNANCEPPPAATVLMSSWGAWICTPAMVVSNTCSSSPAYRDTSAGNCCAPGRRRHTFRVPNNRARTAWGAGGTRVAAPPEPVTCASSTHVEPHHRLPVEMRERGQPVANDAACTQQAKPPPHRLLPGGDGGRQQGRSALSPRQPAPSHTHQRGRTGWPCAR
jgi:hypothetical protein